MNSPRPQSSAAEVLHIREQLGLSQVRLAQLLDVSNVTVNRWERGHTEPSAAALARLRALDGVRPPSLDLPADSSGGPTRLVGREQERAILGAMAAGPGLVTITGAAGVGKTRLAIEVFRTHRLRFPDGAVLVDLVPLPAGSSITTAVTRALGLRDAPGSSPAQRLARGIAGRSLLLLLDNAEHVWSSCRDTVKLILAAEPNTSVIVTSRRPLDLPTERLLRLEPLPIHAGPGSAAELFEIRARERHPAVALDPASPALIALCRRLDGLPLAIELAAARTPVLSPHQILARMQDRFQLLRDESTPSGRQRSLDAAIEWSVDLLSPDERDLFSRLAVFPGSFDADAVDAVVARFFPDSSTAGLLDHLIANSLIEFGAGNEETSAPRFRMLDSIRTYALRLLTGHPEREATWRAFAAAIATRLESALPCWGTAAQVETVRGISLENASITPALGWAAAHDAALAARIAAAAWPFWHAVGSYEDGARLLMRILPELPDSPPLPLANAWFGLGRLQLRLADYPAAHAAAGRALELFVAAGDQAGEGNSVNLLGSIAQRLGNYDEARELHRRARSLNAALGGETLAALLVSQAQLANYEGEHDRAAGLLAEAWELLRDSPNLELQATILNGLGDVNVRRNDPRHAIDFYERSLEISRQLQIPEAIAAKLTNLAEANLLIGNLDVALSLANEGAARYRQLANREHLADALYVQGFVLVRTTDLAAAAAVLQEALRLTESIGNIASTAQTLELLAEVALRAGDPAIAARWIGAGAALRARIGAPPYPPSGYEATVAAIRTRLGDDRYAAECRVGSVASATETLLGAMHYRPRTASPGQTGGGPLTIRQRQVLRLVSRGCSNQAIARELAISERTVERHISAIFTLTRTNRRAAAVAYALQHGWLLAQDDAHL